MKIGPRRLPTGIPSSRSFNTTTQIQQQATKRNIEQAKLQNTVTLGRQTSRSSDLEKATRTAAKAKPEQAKKTEAETNSQPTLENTKQSFLTAFGEELSPQETKQIMAAASSSLEELKGSGKNPDGAAVMAAHTYNFSKRSLQEALPDGATLSEARKLANSHPEIAGKLALIDSASAYMKQVKQNKNSSSQTAEPQPQKPGGISREALAEMQADNVRTMLEVSKGWQQVFSERQKSAAQIYKLAADTSQEISDIYQQLHLRRAKSHAKHARQYVHLLTEVWPES
jgi:hypothetical protein